MNKRLLLLSLLTLSGLLHTQAWAATSVAVNAPINATAPLPASATAPISLNVDHGVPLTLGAPAVSVFIANPDIADVQVMSPTSIMVFGKRTGETTFMATDANGNTLAQHTVIVTQDLGPLRQELSTAIPGSRIHVDSLPNGIVLTGEAKDPSTVADAYKIAMRYIPSGGDIINRVKVVGSNQIMIRVRFAEVERNIDNELGFNWNNLATVGGFTFGIATGIAGLAGGTGILGNRPNNTDLSTPNDVIGFSRSGQGYSVNGLIDALAQDGLITILAEPNLTAMSGETANFLAGGEFPIPVPQGNNQLSIQFKDYGISLEFTPTIIGENRINLHVKPEVSQLTTTGSVTIDSIAVPALLTRKAETTVEVASGQSFAIAGLLDNSQAQTINKYPLLGDLPVLGALFRDSRFQNGQTELIIVITPYIVTPSGQQLALPTDGMSPPSEVDRLLKLRTNSSDPATRTISGAPVGTKAVPIPVPPVPSSALMPQDTDPGATEAPIAATPDITAPDGTPTNSLLVPTSLPATATAPVRTPAKTIAVTVPRTVAVPAPVNAETAHAAAPVIPEAPEVTPPVDSPDDLAADNTPVVQPVPTAVVASVPAPHSTPSPASTPAPVASPAHSKPATTTPAGPGGFVLE